MVTFLVTAKIFCPLKIETKGKGMSALDRAHDARTPVEQSIEWHNCDM